jgi:G3E family GTPase
VLNLGLFTAEGKSPDVAGWLSEEAYGTASAHGHAHEHHHDDHDHNGHGHPEHDPHGHAQDHGHAHHSHDVNRHDDLIRAFCFTLEQPIPEQTLVAWLELLMGFVGSHILRVKGILNIEGNAQPIVVHGVQHIFHPPVSLPAWPSEDRRSRLVFITYGIDRAVIEATFNALAEGAVA